MDNNEAEEGFDNLAGVGRTRGQKNVFFSVLWFWKFGDPLAQKAILVLFLPLKEENFQSFPKNYYHWALRSPKQIHYDQ